MKRLFVCWILAMLPVLAEAETFKARLEWAHTVGLRFVEDGVVEEVPVLEGQVVKEGDVLAILDQRDFEVSRTEAKARIRRSEAALARAERQLGWTQELYDRGLISDNERLEAEENAASARAELELAQASLQKAEIALERSVLKAPYDGVLVDVQTWRGQVVVKQLQKDPLVVVADGKRMVARARLIAERMHTLRPGEPAEIRVEQAGWRKGYVYRLGVESEDIIDRGAVYPMDVVFAVTPEEGLRPGQSAYIQIGRP